MNSIFLSYTYSPHPNFEDETEKLVKCVRVMIEAMGIPQVVTGEDLGGNQLSQEIKQRIESSEGLIALETPWQELAGNGGFIPSDWVRTEFAHAEALGKQLIAVVHDKVVASSAFKNREHVVFHPPDNGSVLLKLMRTISLWKTRLGNAHEVEILPQELALHLDEENPQHLCEFRTLHNHSTSAWRKASFWHDLGGAYAYLTGIPDGATVQMRVTVGQDVWNSAFARLDRIALKKEG